MRRFLKPSVVSEADTVLKLLQIDFEKQSNYCDAKKVDPGFVADKLITTLLHQKCISDMQALQFRMETKSLLKTVVKHMLEKSPMNYRLVRSLSCLDPRKLCHDPERSTFKFKRVLQCMVDAKRVEAEQVDELVSDFVLFANN